MNKKIKIGILILIIILISFFAINLTGFMTLKEDQKIIIGSIMPLSGDASVFGIPFQETLVLAVNEINENGGINGKQVKIIYEDGKCNNKDSVDAINKLININKAKIIIGGICSGETLAAAPIAEENKVILFSPGSGSPDISFSGDYIFRNQPSDAYSGKKIAEYAIKNNHKQMAIISENTDYPIALSKVFAEKYSTSGGTILIEEKFNTDTKDFKTIIQKVISKNPDAIFLNPQTPKTFTILLKQLKEMGYSGQLYGNEYTRSEEVLKNHITEIEGIIFTEAKFNENDFLTKELLDKLRKEKIDLSFPAYNTKVYDSIYIIKEAIEYCKVIDTECIKDYLYTIENRRGTDGYLTINEFGDAEIDFEIKTIKNGQIIVLE